MTTKKPDLWKTPTARTKLKEIYAYSYKEWGKTAAKKYMSTLEETMQSVVNGTKHTRINPNFSTRFSYCTSQRHHIFFEYKDNKLIVATIFHSAMSVKERMAKKIPAIKREIDKA